MLLGRSPLPSIRREPLMVPKHHPGAQVLADFLMGDCSPGTALLVSRHVELCPQCRGDLQQMGAAEVAANRPDRGEWSAVFEGVDVAPLKGVSGLGEAVYEIRAKVSARFPLDGPIRVAEMLVVAGALL